MTTPIDLITEARHDFERFLIEYGFSRELVQAITENTADQIPMPEGFNRIELRQSVIQGIGMFAKQAICVDELLAPARIAGMRTPAGRYTNHSPRPNAYFKPQSNGDLMLLTKQTIAADEEITIDYRQAGAVNGIGLPFLKAEMLETLRIRFANLQLPIKTGAELERFLDEALQSTGYLPSIPDLVAMV
jgi:hypothetical protein